MHSSFIAYIDESGDEGFLFKEDGRQLAGLQIADAVASSTFYAVNSSRFGITDPSYLHLLRRHVYRNGRSWLGYGMKFLSDFESLKSRMPHLGAAFEGW